MADLGAGFKRFKVVSQPSAPLQEKPVKKAVKKKKKAVAPKESSE